MKTPTETRRGFTLMELVVVMAIIVVLAALTVGILITVQTKQNITKTKVQIALLENGLADYHFDHRAYPANADPEGRQGDEVLHRHLYQGDKIYVAELDPAHNTKGGEAWIEGGTRIVDPWGQSYRYRSGENALSADYDLWSSGPDKKTNKDPNHAHSVNDISNWRD